MHRCRVLPLLHLVGGDKHKPASLRQVTMADQPRQDSVHRNNSKEVTAGQALDNSHNQEGTAHQVRLSRSLHLASKAIELPRQDLPEASLLQLEVQVLMLAAVMLFSQEVAMARLLLHHR